MLIRVRVEPLEKLRSGRMFEFNGGDESENVIPVIFDQFCINIKFRQNLKAEIFINFAFFKWIEALFWKLFEARSKGQAEQMRNGKNDFRKAVRIGWVNVAFNDFVMKQTVNDIGGLAFGAADDGWVKQQMPFINKTVHRHTFILSEVFERVIGV